MNTPAPSYTIPWYRSPVFTGALVSVITQIAVLAGVSDLVSEESVATTVDGILELVAVGSALLALYKRGKSDVQPLTLKKQKETQYD